MRYAFALLATLAFVQTARPAEVVAIGASNTAGRGIGKTRDGVDADQAFPAQLEHLLHERNCNVSVTNAGVPGDTTEGIKDRAPGAVSSDTKVLIVEVPVGNDERKQVTNTAENVAAIKAFAQSHGVTFVRLGNWLSVAGLEHRQPDRQHFDAAAHLMMAKYLLPTVRRAVGCR